MLLLRGKMIYKIKLLLAMMLLVYLPFVSTLNAQTNEHFFQWDLTVGERLEIVRTADVIYIENSIQRAKYEERNIVDLTAYAKTPNGRGYRIKGLFKTYKRLKGETLFQLDREFTSDFVIETDGKYIVPRQYFMPNVRSVPTFPSMPLKVGDTWSAPSEEFYFDSFDRPLTLALNTSYIISSFSNENGTNIATIDYNNIINKDLEQAGIRGNKTPRVIHGYNNAKYYWDMDRNVPVYSSEFYHVFFGFGANHGYASIEYKMDLETFYNIYEPIKEEDLIDEVERLKEGFGLDDNSLGGVEQSGQGTLGGDDYSSQLKKAEENFGVNDNNGNSAIEVAPVEQGIAVRLGDLLFDTNSDTLKSSSKETLDKIISTIKEMYPDREIVVEGHTDNTGSSNYNQNLSERRAKRVAGEIEGALDHDKVSYKGKGETEPIQSNSTAAGRAKNRRVDIIIKLR